MSCMFYFNWWAYYWNPDSSQMHSAQQHGPHPGFPFWLCPSAGTDWAGAGRWAPAVRAFLEHHLWHCPILCNLPQLLNNKQLGLATPSLWATRGRAEGWDASPGLHCQPRVDSGEGFRFTSLSPVLTGTICCHLPPDEQKAGSERTGYGNYSPVLILLARNIKHKAN